MSKFGQERGLALRSTVEVPMVEPEVVRVMSELRRLGWGYRSIAREVGTGVMTVKRYLRGGAKAGEQERPRARRLDGYQLTDLEVGFSGTGDGLVLSGLTLPLCP